VTSTFAARFEKTRATFGPLCWGIDPSREVLERWAVTDTPDGLDRFADIVLEAASGSIGILKPQSAFFERHGWRGFRTLQRLVADARGSGLLVIVDAKRGDVGTTNDAYAQAFLGPDAPLAADALTVHPYLGLGAMNAFVDRAFQSGSCLLVVTRSSNPEGRPIQSARLSSSPSAEAGPSAAEAGLSVEAALLAGIGALNARLTPGGIGPVGAVIGPTHIQPRLDLRAPHCLYLAPGVGAQGATPRDVAEVFADCPDRVIPSASRSLLQAGPDRHRLRDAISALAAEFAQLLAPAALRTEACGLRPQDLPAPARRSRPGWPPCSCTGR
jgi:orotidine-5'-phosphate decarboxylase